jgi:hypothetical protein
MTDLQQVTENVGSSLAQVDKSLQTLGTAILSTEELLNKVFDPKGKLPEFQKKFLENVKNINDLLGARTDSIRSKFEEELMAQGVEGDDLATRLGLLNSFLDSRVDTVLVKANEDTKMANEEVRKMAENFSTSISKAFSGMVIKGELSARKIGDAFLNAALQAASEKFSTKPLSSFFDRLFGSLPGRAGGGAVGAGLPVLVGERGPEVFVPRLPGVVLNSQDSRRTLGGSRVTINQTLHFATDVQNSVRAEILNAAPLIASQAATFVINSLRGIRT